MPKAMVIDLSHYNGNAEFTKVQAFGTVGVIHKATQGTDYVDPDYVLRKPAAQQAGLLWGAYHFGTGDDVNSQVANFLKATQPDGSFLLALDFERNGNHSMSLDQAKQFLASVASQTGHKPVLYTGSYFNHCTRNQTDSSMAQYRVWWAEYGDEPKELNPTWSTYWLWQYSDGSIGPDDKAVEGAAPCDCSTHAGDESQLRATWLG